MQVTGTAESLIDGEEDGQPEVVQIGQWEGKYYMRCFDGETGEVRWSSDRKFANNRAPVLVDWDRDGKDDILSFTHDRGARHLTVLRATDGKVIHSVATPTKSPIYSSLIVGDLNADGIPDVVAARYDENDIAAFNGATGEILWRVETSANIWGGGDLRDLNLDGTPDVITSASGDGTVSAISGTDGDVIWSTSVGIKCRSGPIVWDVDGRPYVAVVALEGPQPAASHWRMHVLDGRDGEVKWAAGPEGATESLGRPFVTRVDGATWAVAAFGDAGLAAYNVANGEQVWRSLTDVSVIASPAFADLDSDGNGEIVAGTTRGQVFVIDLATGAEMWHVLIGESHKIEGQPAVVADLNGDRVLDIVVADHGFNLTAISGAATKGARRRLNQQLPP